MTPPTTRPPDPLAGAQPGERWVIRHRLPDGSATDLIGWLDELAPERLHLTTADAAHHVVDRADVLAARRAPAAPGGPPPERTSPDELERHALTGWLARHEPLGEWTLRAGGGFTGRANSCLAVGDPRLPVPDAAMRIQAYAAQHDIPARAQVVRGGEPERALRALGWSDTYVPTDVLAVRLADLLGTTSRPPRVGLSEQLDGPWWDAYGESQAGRVVGPDQVDPALVRLILTGHPPQAFASVADPDAPGSDPEGRLLAIGRGHVSADWLGYAALWTRPGHRRQGWARQLVLGLGHWGARRGARYAYLQVASANSDAVAAYRRLGFRLHHSYRYLQPPAR